MFMTALSSHAAKITFASVHDCFWTHASTVDQMNTILREEFVKLHSQPILANLRDELVERYRSYVIPEGLTKGRGPTGDIRHIQVSTWRPINIPPIPPKGDFDISQVLRSDYFFS
jgi:DNA-directed RNA polymerase